MWKPKTTFKSYNKGVCPNCGHEFSIEDMFPLSADIEIVTEDYDPKAKHEPDEICPSCGAELIFDAALKLEINTQVFKK